MSVAVHRSRTRRGLAAIAVLAAGCAACGEGEPTYRWVTGTTAPGRSAPNAVDVRVQVDAPKQSVVRTEEVRDGRGSC